MNLLEPIEIHNFLPGGVNGVTNLNTCVLDFLSCLGSSQFMFLCMVFNLRISSGFIFEPCS